MQNFLDRIRESHGFAVLFGELGSSLSLYWTTASQILQGGGIALLDPPEGYFSPENNFFSALFLYSYHRLNIPRPRRILYAAVNQCFRGMVTGCDNILDAEYKRTLETDLPAQAWRFRSVLDIMVSEHVLFTLLVSAARRGEIKEEHLLPATDAALQALTRSGAQEAGEEGGTKEALTPDAVLRSVHHYKTGLLFQAPWAVPALIEPLQDEKMALVKEGLYKIGMGCQVLDDMVDLHRDVLQGRHNFVVSLIYHDQCPMAWAKLHELASSSTEGEGHRSLLHHFPEARRAAASAARTYLTGGIICLWESPSHYLIEAIVSILAQRIGAEAFLVQDP
jgi:hypothetical protein